MNNDFELPLQKRKRKMLITPDIIDKVPCTKIFGMNSEENRYIQCLHKELLQVSMRKNKSNEVGFLVDVTTWNKIVLFGNEHGIIMDMYPDAKTLLENAPNRHLIFLHNHPNNSCFSGKDLSSFCRHNSLALITAIQNDGNIHVLAKNINFYPNATLFEYNKGVERQKGVENVLQQTQRLGILYKYGRCKK